MSDHTDIPPNNDGGIDLETLVNALAENKEIGQPSEHYPSSGRVLKDSVDGTIYLGDGDQWLTVSTDSGLSTPAVDAEEADITNETFIQAERDTRTSTITANTWTNLADTKREDNRNEQDGLFNINLDETGWYQVSGAVTLLGSSDQDPITVAVRDTDADSLVRNGRAEANISGNSGGLQFAFVVKLTAGTNYRVQVKNRLNSYKVEGDDNNSEMSHYAVRRSIVHS